jgi:hypothetical protein
MSTVSISEVEYETADLLVCQQFNLLLRELVLDAVAMAQRMAQEWMEDKEAN